MSNEAFARVKIEIAAEGGFEVKKAELDWSAMDAQTRAELERDQRRRLVSLTDRSRALAARMEPEIEAVYEGLERRVDRARLRGLYRSLDELLAVLESQPVRPRERR